VFEIDRHSVNYSDIKSKDSGEPAEAKIILKADNSWPKSQGTSLLRDKTSDMIDTIVVA
jgi:hypothetical protein